VGIREIEHHFALDVDLDTVARSIAVDPIIRRALKAHWGLRIIRQDPWECLVSFILSQFNNIPRLIGMLRRLIQHFGEPFPRPEQLASASDRTLRGLGLGFRAAYLKATAKEVAMGRADLKRWQDWEDEALRLALMTLPGVGEKVADCIMLFAYGRTSAFPVDVWIKRAMRRWYFPHQHVTDRKIRAFARRHFGPWCGWAQQYLFCHIRADGAT
jgi:N-glycosylase/DNA lyase